MIGTTIAWGKKYYSFISTVLRLKRQDSSTFVIPPIYNVFLLFYKFMSVPKSMKPTIIQSVVKD